MAPAAATTHGGLVFDYTPVTTPVRGSGVAAATKSRTPIISSKAARRLASETPKVIATPAPTATKAPTTLASAPSTHRDDDDDGGDGDDDDDDDDDDEKYASGDEVETIDSSDDDDDDDDDDATSTTMTVDEACKSDLTKIVVDAATPRRVDVDVGMSTSATNAAADHDVSEHKKKRARVDATLPVAAAAAETSAKASVEKPAKASVEKPAKVPAEKPAKVPAKAPVEKPAKASVKTTTTATEAEKPAKDQKATEQPVPTTAVPYLNVDPSKHAAVAAVLETISAQRNAGKITTRLANIWSALMVGINSKYTTTPIANPLVDAPHHERCVATRALMTLLFEFDGCDVFWQQIDAACPHIDGGAIPFTEVFDFANDAQADFACVDGDWQRAVTRIVRFIKAIAAVRSRVPHALRTVFAKAITRARDDEFGDDGDDVLFTPVYSSSGHFVKSATPSTRGRAGAQMFCSIIGSMLYASLGVKPALPIDVFTPPPPPPQAVDDNDDF